MYGIIRNLTKFMNAGMYDYCQLEGPDLAPGETTTDRLVTREGALLSVIEVRGSYQYAGSRRFESHLADLLSRMEAVMKQPGFRLEFVFIRDPENGRTALNPSIEAAKATAHRIGLDAEQLLEERARVLGEKTALERCYLTLRTDSSLFNPATAQDAAKTRLNKMKGSNISIKPGEFGQSPFIALQGLRDAHNAMMQTLTDSLSAMLSVVTLEAHDAVAAIATCMGADYKHPKWRPAMLGDRIRPRESTESGYPSDISHLMQPDIAFQLFHVEPSVAVESPSIVNFGGRYYAPMSVDIPPQQAMRLNTLLNDMDNNLPWMVKIAIDSGHANALSKVSSKFGWASFLAFSSRENQLIRDSARALQAMADGGDTLCMMQMTACTWGRDYAEISKRKAIFMQKMQGWGGLEVIEESGDPVHGWVSCLPGMSRTLAANRFPMPLYEAMRMAPLERPSSPWEAGTVLYRTLDNKVFPYWPGSAKQTTSSSLVYAPPGFGKSFSLSATNMGLLMSPGLKELPKLAILDIGYSSRAFVELLRDMLPEHKRHQALAVDYQMTPEYAFNPFDTPLGCRQPLAVDRSFVVNFLTLVLTPAAASEEIPRLSEMVGALIDSMYVNLSDDMNPHRYEPGVNAEADALIEQYHVEIDADTTWWQLTDIFFEKGLFREAALVQRYAMPTLNDATGVLASDSGINNLYGQATHNGESLIAFINTQVISAIREYPVLGQPTAFDLGDARVVAIDLSSVAQSGSRQADKQTAVMYMLARHMLCKDFYRNLDSTRQIPETYRAYHRQCIEEALTTPKKICMDELHRTSHSPQVRAQIKIDLREGRKYGVSIDLLSQMLDDFDDDMIRLVTNTYILSRGNSEDDLRQIVDKFKPTADVANAIRHELTGPGREGSSMLYFGTLKGEREARVEMILRLTLGPSEIWAYSTTPEDVRLRSMLADRVGLSPALEALGRRFPGGSAKAQLQQMQLDSTDGDDVYKTLATEMAKGDQ